MRADLLSRASVGSKSKSLKVPWAPDLPADQAGQFWRVNFGGRFFVQTIGLVQGVRGTL